MHRPLLRVTILANCFFTFLGAIVGVAVFVESVSHEDACTRKSEQLHCWVGEATINMCVDFLGGTLLAPRR